MMDSRELSPWTCRGCGRNTKSASEQWWHLTNHYGFTGSFCSDCYSKIKDPQERVLMILRLEKG